MDVLSDIADLVRQYDWREPIAIAIGTSIGTLHALHDTIRGRKKRISAYLLIASGATSGLLDTSDSYYRNTMSTLLGSASYIGAYEGVYRLANRLFRRRKLELQE